MRILPFLFFLALILANPVAAQTWDEVARAARGQTVYWYAWGGAQVTNDFIAWTAEQVGDRYGVDLRHVKINDTATAVGQVVAEKAAGREEGGSVDLVWINGENFAAMKGQDLLFGPWTERLPNYALVDTGEKPTLTHDFTVPVEGLESPWSMTQFVFVYDSAAVSDPPRTMGKLLVWARANPGRFTYPQPPDFTGSTFLKQALYELIDDPAKLSRPVEDGAFAASTEPLWAFLDELHPNLWRQGQVFPTSDADQLRLMGDGEIDIAVSFNPLEAASGIAAGILPPTARVFTLEGGTIANANFVAIPFNANAKEGAMVVANFLLSPEAQAKRRDPRFGGTFSVLNMEKLTPEGRRFFEALPSDPAAPDPEELGIPLAEPHPSWMERLEAEWQRRYHQG